MRVKATDQRTEVINISLGPFGNAPISWRRSNMPWNETLSWWQPPATRSRQAWRFLRLIKMSFL